MSAIQIRELDALATAALEALEAGGAEGFPLVDGRIVSVQVTPDAGTSSDIAMGVAALPPDYSTPPHDHRAEEVAVILRGSGKIIIEDEIIPVSPGSVVVTPPHAPHTTASSVDGPMVVFWMYSPAGSERRWLDADGE